jgi:phospholipid/cholesterol/gamma-HCH transport system substrate-binding protein
LIALLAKLKTELSVGLLIMVGSGLLVYSSVRVTQYSPDLSETYTVSASFDNVAGLAIGTAIRIAGIKVGEIKKIDLVEGKAQVTMAVYKKYPLRSNSGASIKSLGVLGDKFIELTMGSQNDSMLKNGDKIQNIRPGADLDSLVNNLSLIMADIKSVTKSLKDSMGGEQGTKKFNNILKNTEDMTRNLNESFKKVNLKISSILLNVEGFTKNLNNITAENQAGIKNVISNLDKFTKDLKDISQKNRSGINKIVTNFGDFSGDLKNLMKKNQDKITSLVSNIEKVSKNLADKAPEMTKNLNDSLRNLNSSSEKLDSSMANFDSITGKMDRGEGTIGKLLNDEKTADSLNEALDGVNKFLNQADRIRLDIGFRGEYLTSAGDFKSYLDIDIRPVRDHYYRIGLVKNPRGKDETTTTTTSTTTSGTTTSSDETKKETTEEFVFSAQIVQRFYDTELRIGLIESTFGVGVDQYFGRNDEFRINLDIFDFGRDDEGTHFKIGMKWKFHNNLYFVAGADDFLNTQSKYQDYYVGFGIQFNEDTAKLLLSSISLPTN